MKVQLPCPWIWATKETGKLCLGDGKQCIGKECKHYREADLIEFSKSPKLKERGCGL